MAIYRIAAVVVIAEVSLNERASKQLHQLNGTIMIRSSSSSQEEIECRKSRTTVGADNGTTLVIMLRKISVRSSKSLFSVRTVDRETQQAGMNRLCFKANLKKEMNDGEMEYLKDKPSFINVPLMLVASQSASVRSKILQHQTESSPCFKQRSY